MKTDLIDFLDDYYIQDLLIKRSKLKEDLSEIDEKIRKRYKELNQ